MDGTICLQVYTHTQRIRVPSNTLVPERFILSTIDLWLYCQLDQQERQLKQSEHLRMIVASQLSVHY